MGPQVILVDILAGTTERGIEPIGRSLSAGFEEKLAAEVAGWMKKAAAQDAAEDRQHGGDRRG